MRRHNLKDKYPFPVEFTPSTVQIYHGPKKRMLYCLSAFDQTKRNRIAQDEFLDYILHEYSRYVDSIQKVKFYIYHKTIFSDSLYFAIIWVGDDAPARNELYDKGPEITLQTGWYPLITGSRIGRKAHAADIYMREEIRKCINRSKFESMFNIGSPLSIEKAYDGAGNAILLKTTKWNILLDTGADSRRLRLDKLDNEKKTIVILSHAHTDHIGGLLDIIRNRNFFIITNEITLDFVLNRYDYFYGLKNILPKNFFYRVFPTRYDCVYHFESGGSLAFFYSSHYPGSSMILVKFSNSKRLLYTGDFSLSSVFGEGTKQQFFNPSSLLWNTVDGKLDYFIVDAAVAFLHKDKSSLSKTEFLERLDTILSHNGSVVLFAEPQDSGLFLYFDLFTRYVMGVKNERIPIYVDPLVKRQLETIDKYLKLRRTNSLWPQIQQLIKRRVTPCESVWLFEMSNRWPINVEIHRKMKKPILFILDLHRAINDNYDNASAFSKVMSEADLICCVGKSSGHGNLVEKFKDGLLETKEICMPVTSEILLLDDGPWMPHCTHQELETVLKCVRDRVSNVIFFHRNSEDLEQLAKEVSRKINISAIGLPVVSKPI